MSAALLIIDVQHAVCYSDPPAFEVPRVIERINQVAAKARAAGRPVIVIQHESPEGPLQHGAPGWQLARGLSTHASDLAVRKRAADSFHETDLRAVLESRGATSLIICGLQSEFCIDTTTRRALALGYPVQLVSDGHSTADNGVLSASQITAHHNETLANITSFGPRVRAISAAEVDVEA
jgi:nicotinamidase-related amidase